MQELHILLLTLVPTLELRASIPYGILATDLPVALVLLLAIITNILLGFFIYELTNEIITLARKMRWFDKLFTKIIDKTQRKIRGSMDKYGEIGVAFFIGIPLPGSGVYTAAIAAELLGIKRRQFYIATIIGVLIAATLVTIIVLSGEGIHTWMIKPV